MSLAGLRPDVDITYATTSAALNAANFSQYKVRRDSGKGKLLAVHGERASVRLRRAFRAESCRAEPCCAVRRCGAVRSLSTCPRAAPSALAASRGS